MSIVFPYFFYCSADHRGLHSFPTRRSSDLEDGLADVQIEMVSARTGDGVDRLRSLLAEVIAGESVAARTARDEVAAVRRRLAGHVGAQDPTPPEAAAVAEDLATASGVPSVAASIRRPVASPRAVALAEVQRPASSRTAAIRDRWLGQAAAGLPAPWREAVVQTVAEEPQFDEHVWTALHSQALPRSEERRVGKERWDRRAGCQNRKQRTK